MQDLRKLIEVVSEQALLSGSLIFTPTSLEIVNAGSIPFQVRLSPTLAKKPNTKINERKHLINPFMPPAKELTLIKLKDHNLVLNKYAISKGHILITCSDYQTQFGIICQSEIEIIKSIINALNSTDLLFFYNCGSKSGASVLHKHIQMLNCVEGGIPISTIIQRTSEPDGVIFKLPEFEFTHGCVKLKPTYSSSEIYSKVCEILRSVFNEIDPSVYEKYISLKKDEELEPSWFISYNFLMTDSWVLIVPRSNDIANGVGLNSVAFAGFILVKSTEHLDIVKKGPMDLLNQITYKNKL